MVERKHVVFNDKKNMNDQFVAGEAKGCSAKPVKGRVQIHARDLGEGKKLYLVEDTSNLIVYRGRSWLMQRAFAQDQPNDVPSGSRAWSSRWIRWFGIGEGGASVGDPLIAEPPGLDNCQLVTPGTLGTTNPGVIETTDGSHQFVSFDSGYPKFTVDTEVPAIGETLCTDSSATDPFDLANHDGDEFLVGVMQMTLTSGMANGTGYQDLSEAGLFCSDTGTTFADIDDLNIFARVSFSTIRKTSSRELIFTWYIYF